MAGRRPQDTGDATGRGAGPARPDDQIAAGPGAVHAAEVAEAVGPLVSQLVEPEPIAEIGDLHDDRCGGQIEDSETVEHVAVGAGHEWRSRCHLVGEHGQLIERRDRQATALAGPGDERHASPALMHVGQRPSPEIRFPGQRLDVQRPNRGRSLADRVGTRDDGRGGAGTGVDAERCGDDRHQARERVLPRKTDRAG